MNQEKIFEALKQVMDPELGKNLVELNMVENIHIDNDTVGLDLVLTTPACPLKHQMRNAVETALKGIGFKEVKVNLTSRVQQHKTQQTSQFIDMASFEGIKNIIPVYSTKGGVGKSTVAVNLAVALAECGAKVGLLDADMYGPSVPRMMGIVEPPQTFANRIVPITAYGVGVMSLGVLLEDNSRPVIWRGPLVNTAIRQLFEDVAWEDIDYLIADLPPGTGDVQITFAQNVPISGAVFVSTPQAVAVDDMVRGLGMFEALEVPVLGIVKNMSYFSCPHCGEKSPIFPSDNFDLTVKKMNIRVLGELPVDPQISIGGDTGKPAVIAYPESETAQAFRKLAGEIAGAVSALS